MKGLLCCSIATGAVGMRPIGMAIKNKQLEHSEFANTTSRANTHYLLLLFFISCASYYKLLE